VGLGHGNSALAVEMVIATDRRRRLVSETGQRLKSIVAMDVKVEPVAFVT
jgi:hypothetical protein